MTRPATRLRFALPAVALALTLAACGGDSDDGDNDAAADPTAESSSSESRNTGDAKNACDLLSLDEVSEIAGTELSEGVGGSGPVATGGTQITCSWNSAETPINYALVTVYSERSAADSVKEYEPDAEAVEGVGDEAFVGPLASVWAYVGDKSFTAQWYEFDAVPEDSLDESIALAKLVADRI